MEQGKNTVRWMIGAGVLFVLTILYLMIATKADYQKKVDQTIRHSLEHLVEVTEDPKCILAVEEQSKKNESLTMPEILKMDQEWIVSPEHFDIIARCLNNETSLKLQEFMEQHPSFQEIFITDKHGINVAATNKTSDCYQADETWWQQTVEKGTFIGEVEYDASAGVWSHPVCTVINNSKGELVGVVKAVLDIRGLR